MPAGRSVSPQEKREIRKYLRDVLKHCPREDLLAILYDIMWGRSEEYKDYEAMKKVKIETSRLTDQELIKKILDRDVKEVVESINKGY